MRLTFLLLGNPATNLPAVNALFALMSFQVSRFEARTHDGETVLYEHQDETLWDQAVIAQGRHFLDIAFKDTSRLSRYHLEAGIACCHTQKADTPEKWEHILQLHNHLLVIHYSPMAALNRTYALFKVKGNTAAIAEAEKLALDGHHLYHSLLAELYRDTDPAKGLSHLEQAIALTRSAADRALLQKKLAVYPGR